MTVDVLPHPDVVARRLDDSVVLVNLATNRIFTLNPTGSRVWDLLVAGRTAAEIRQALQGEFAVTEEQLDREIGSLVNELMSEGLVLPTDGTAT